jgi:hypothetical protein
VSSEGDASTPSEPTPEGLQTPPADESPRKKGKRRLRRVESKLDAALSALVALDERLAQLERVQHETVEALDRVRKAVREVDAEMARRGDVKKLKKVLDQLEVVEIAEGPAGPQPES